MPLRGRRGRCRRRRGCAWSGEASGSSAVAASMAPTAPAASARLPASASRALCHARGLPSHARGLPWRAAGLPDGSCACAPPRVVPGMCRAPGLPGAGAAAAGPAMVRAAAAPAHTSAVPRPLQRCALEPVGACGEVGQPAAFLGSGSAGRSTNGSWRGSCSGAGRQANAPGSCAPAGPAQCTQSSQRAAGVHHDMTCVLCSA